jgi:hypothetical protein
VKKSVPSFLALDRKFLKPKIPLLELSINCQKRTDEFFHLIESFKSTEMTLIKLDQVKA